MDKKKQHLDLVPVVELQASDVAPLREGDQVKGVRPLRLGAPLSPVRVMDAIAGHPNKARLYRWIGRHFMAELDGRLLKK